MTQFVVPPDLAGDPHRQELTHEVPQGQPQNACAHRLAAFACEREQLDMKRRGGGPQAPGRRRLHVLAAAHAKRLVAHGDDRVVDHLANTLFVPDGTLEEPEVTDSRTLDVAAE